MEKENDMLELLDRSIAADNKRIALIEAVATRNTENATLKEFLSLFTSEQLVAIRTFLFNNNFYF